jgi:hypothetical protein
MRPATMHDVANFIDNHEFIADMCRFAEGVLTEAQVKRRWQKIVDDATWNRLGEDEELITLIQAEKIRRIRSGQTAREKAQLHAIKAPDILDRIMTDESISPRHKIEASREMRAIAATGPEAAPTAERYVITINLGADEKIHINKPIALGRLDDNGEIIDDTAPSELLAIASKRENGGGDDNPL